MKELKKYMKEIKKETKETDPVSSLAQYIFNESEKEKITPEEYMFNILVELMEELR